MPFVLSCPKCNKSFRVPDSAEGKLVKCSDCGHQFEAKDEIDFESPPPLPSYDNVESENSSWHIPPISVTGTSQSKVGSSKGKSWILPSMAGFLTASVIAAFVFIAMKEESTDIKTKAINVSYGDQWVHPPNSAISIIANVEASLSNQPGTWVAVKDGVYSNQKGVGVSFAVTNPKQARYSLMTITWRHDVDGASDWAGVTMGYPGVYINESDREPFFDGLIKWIADTSKPSFTFNGLVYRRGPTTYEHSTILISEL